ncbi:hypothetical protein ACG7TL_008539 [Trametes sanguinea]
MSDSAAAAAELEALFTVLHDTQVVTYSTVGALTWLLYDTLINLYAEITYIWLARWSLPKVLYIVARYYSIMHLAAVLAFDVQVGLSRVSFVVAVLTVMVSIYPESCRAWLWIYSLAGLVVFTTIVNIILVLRLHAIYERDRRVLIFLSIVMTCQFTIEMTMTIWGARAKIVDPPIFPWPGCLADGLRLRTLGACLVHLTLPGSVLCLCMTVRKFFQVAVINWDQLKVHGVSPLFRTFVRDGALFFFLCVVACLPHPYGIESPSANTNTISSPSIFAVDLVTAMLTVFENSPYASLTEPVRNVGKELVAITIRRRSALSADGEPHSYPQGVKMVLNLRISAHHPANTSAGPDDDTLVTEYTDPRFATGSARPHHAHAHAHFLSIGEDEFEMGPVGKKYLGQSSSRGMF